MQMTELQSQHHASTLRGALLFLCEQFAQYLRGLAANFTTLLTKISRRGLRCELR